MYNSTLALYWPTKPTHHPSAYGRLIASLGLAVRSGRQKGSRRYVGL